jgi:hypothetical protein
MATHNLLPKNKKKKEESHTCSVRRLYSDETGLAVLLSKALYQDYEEQDIWEVLKDCRGLTDSLATIAVLDQQEITDKSVWTSFYQEELYKYVCEELSLDYVDSIKKQCGCPIDSANTIAQQIVVTYSNAIRTISVLLLDIFVMHIGDDDV